jgi:3-isopropylmalate dehydrogenase
LYKGKDRKILVLPGDGVGPEITKATIEVLNAADRRFELNVELERDGVGFAAVAAFGSACPPDAIGRSRATDGRGGGA